MTYEKIVAMMQTYYVNADATKVNGHYAVQVNVIGEGEGAFYIEISDGKVNVQPYDYVDRDGCISVSAEILTVITKGETCYCEAAKASQITITGDEQTAAVLDSIQIETVESKTEAVMEATETVTVQDNKKSTVKKAPARKRAYKKASSNSKKSKKA